MSTTIVEDATVSEAELDAMVPDSEQTLAVVLPDPIALARECMSLPTVSEKQDRARTLARDKAFLEACKVGGEVIVGQVGIILHKAGLGSKALRAAMNEAGLSPSKTAEGGSSTTYESEAGRLLVRVGKTLEPLTEFDARIIEVVVKDAGNDAPQKLVYRIAGVLPDGTLLPTIDVSSEEYPDMRWISRWGPRAILHAGRTAKDEARTAIQLLSESPPSRTVYTHIGWRRVSGKWVYLTPNGAIGGDDVPVEVTFDERFALRQPSDDTEKIEAVQASLGILRIGKREVVYPLMASTWTSPLTTLLGIDFGLWIVGTSGAMKSTCAALAQAHFGSFSATSLPGSWWSTKNFLEDQLNLWKDASFVLDNYVPNSASPKDQADLRSKALAIIQAFGDGAFRGRLDKNGDARPGKRPRCSVIYTGEDLPPTNPSTLGRLVVVDMQKGDIDTLRLSHVQARQELLPVAMRAYIEWIAADFDARVGQVKQYEKAHITFFRAALADAHPRASGNCAKLMAGFQSFLDFAVDVGAESGANREAHARHLRTVLIAIAGRAKENVEASPGDMYLSTLRDLLVQGRIKLVPTTEPLFDEMAKGIQVRAIGWEDLDKVCLVPSLALDAVTTFLGSRWVHTEARVRKDLRTADVLHPDDDGHLTPKKKLGGQWQRVLVLSKSALVPEGAADDHSDNDADGEMTLGYH